MRSIYKYGSILHYRLWERNYLSYRKGLCIYDPTIAGTDSFAPETRLTRTMRRTIRSGSLRPRKRQPMSWTLLRWRTASTAKRENRLPVCVRYIRRTGPGRHPSYPIPVQRTVRCRNRCERSLSDAGQILQSGPEAIRQSGCIAGCDYQQPEPQPVRVYERQSDQPPGSVWPLRRHVKKHGAPGINLLSTILLFTPIALLGAVLAGINAVWESYLAESAV